MRPLAAGLVLLLAVPAGAGPRPGNRWVKTAKPKLGFSARVSSIVVLKDGSALVAGDFTGYRGQEAAFGLAKLDKGCQLDAEFSRRLPRHIATELGHLLLVQPDGAIISVGTFKGGVERLSPSGIIDRSYLGNRSWEPHARGFSAAALQADGGLLVGGSFGFLDGKELPRLLRLGPDGRYDAAFTVSPAPFTRVFDLAVVPDGRFLAGVFSGSADDKRCVLRYGPDGRLDEGFSTAAAGVSAAYAELADEAPGASSGSLGFQDALAKAVDDRVLLALQPDGRILVAGGFWAFGDWSRRSLLRLNPDGTLDAAFSKNTKRAFSLGEQGYPELRALALQEDGGILVGGRFDRFRDSPAGGLVRLRADGTLDEEFSRVVGAGFSGEDAVVETVALRGRGEILAGGRFSSFNGVAVENFAALDRLGRLIFPAPADAPRGTR